MTRFDVLSQMKKNNVQKSYQGLNANEFCTPSDEKKEVIQLFQVMIQWTHDLVIW